MEVRAELPVPLVSRAELWDLPELRAESLESLESRARSVASELGRCLRSSIPESAGVRRGPAERVCRLADSARVAVRVSASAQAWGAASRRSVCQRHS